MPVGRDDERRTIADDGVEIGKVPFTASIEMALQGVVLRLRDGKVQDIQTGRVKGKVILKCFGAVILRREIDQMPIPGTIRLEPQRAA